jgi:hypothetical protein
VADPLFEVSVRVYADLTDRVTLAASTAAGRAVSRRRPGVTG